MENKVKIDIDNTFSSTKDGGVKMYGEKEWIEVKRLRGQGYGYKSISRQLNMDRRTVKRLSLLETPPVSRRRKRGSRLDKYKGYIDLWLEDNPRLRATDIHQRIEKLGWQGSYSVVKRYVGKKKAEISRKATVRFETLPGKQAQVDFCQLKVRYLDGKQENINIYLMTLGFSRKKEVEISDRQDRESLKYLMEKSLWNIGGVPEEILFDNLRPVAKRARTFKFEGEISEEWQRFERYYGFKSSLAMAYRGQTKGKVERPIDPIKRFIKANIFLNREHLRKQLKEEGKQGLLYKCGRRLLFGACLLCKQQGSGKDNKPGGSDLFQTGCFNNYLQEIIKGWQTEIQLCSKGAPLSWASRL